LDFVEVSKEGKYHQKLESAFFQYAISAKLYHLNGDLELAKKFRNFARIILLQLESLEKSGAGEIPSTDRRKITEFINF
jgi:hypothetical protein